MAAIHSERNIRAKIQEFEKQLNTDEISAPTPRPRNAPRPAVAPKPSAVQRASFSSSTEEEERNTQTFEGNGYGEVMGSNSTPLAPFPPLRPLMPRKPSLTSSDQVKPQPLIKPPPPSSRPSQRRSRPLNSQEEDAVFNAPTLPPRTVHNGHQNVSSHNSIRENEYVDAPVSPAFPNLSNAASFTNAVTRRPTIIRVPSKQEQEVLDCFTSAPHVQRAIGGPPPSLGHKTQDWTQNLFNSVQPALPPRPGGGKVLPQRPPLAKPTPGRPPQPRRDSVLRNSTLQSQQPNNPRRSVSKKAPVLPPRPNPGHRLYNRYTLEIPHAIADYDYNGMHTGELSFQKNEVLVLLSQIDNRTFECQVGDTKGTVQKSHMKVITPLSNYSHHDDNRAAQESASGNSGLQVQALYDFIPENPGEIMLKAGDVIINAEPIDSDWYLGTSKGITGFFPINYVKTLPKLHSLASAPASTPTPARAPATSQKVSGPRCMARFDFEGEHSDELSFSEGQVIRLLEYMGEDWARGEIGGRVGIFPLNFVEILEDLPPSPAKNQSRIPLPGMAASNHMQALASTNNQAYGVERVKALYDFTAEAAGDLSFLSGDVIEVIEHIDEEWSHGRLNGREGLFPMSFTQPHTGGSSHR
ncbi:SH3 domain-containing protein 19 isoform X2 [Clarias gariepinus]|uniref:SH3 domain-containing protein 19 isoform X2 n=1 Tax=Clarias gariepinus TaxID=13013 RepID=UPI00234D5BD1|nr:SH3 domain-containing protein 19 isoform X2 [Clarias gariepinus]